jgi:hypothetical protein
MKGRFALMDGGGRERSTVDGCGWLKGQWPKREGDEVMERKCRRVEVEVEAPFAKLKRARRSRVTKGWKGD